MASTAPDAFAPGRPVERSGASLTDGLLLAMAVIWGVNYSVVKYGTLEIAPLAYNGARIGLAAVALLLISLCFPAGRPSTRDAGALVALGMLGNGLYQLCFIEGIARSRVATVALVFAATPAFIAVAGRVRGSEHVSRRAWSGILLQLGGIAFVVLGASAASTRGDTPLGAFLILLGATCWAAYSVYVKPYTDRIPAIHVGALTLGGGALLVVLAGLPSMLSTPWSTMPAPMWGAVLYSGLGAMVVANLFLYHGVRVLGPTRTAMYSNLQPLIALGVAWMALGEVPTPWQWTGAATIMTGLVLSRT